MLFAIFASSVSRADSQENAYILRVAAFGGAAARGAQDDNLESMATNRAYHEPLWQTDIMRRSLHWELSPVVKL